VLGYSSVVDGYVVKFSSGLSIVNAEMTFDCTGWKSMYALFALVIATPGAALNKKLKFLLVGLPTIFAVNLLRIATTIAFVVSFGIAYLDVVHSILWQEGLIIAVVAVWYLWLRGLKVLNIRIEK
jgi:exosortase/archaeosortase family protein